MNVLDLFSGIGGFTLGLASAGPFRTVAFCECEPFPRDVLAARWPGIPIYPDVRTLTAKQLAADGVVRPDVVVGGFPCQDISSAGKGAGIDGVRSGLWREMARIIGEVRPRWAIIENSPSLRGRGADRVLGDLEALGYAAWPSVVGAVHAGAWHRRQRVWIVAYTDTDGGGQSVERIAQYGDEQGAPRSEPDGLGSRRRGNRSATTIAHTDYGERWRHGPERRSYRRDPVIAGHGVTRRAAIPAYALRIGPQSYRLHDARQVQPGASDSGITPRSWPAQPDLVRVVHGLPGRLDRSAGLEAAEGLKWHPIAQEPAIPRTARGVANRTERIAGLGNAVVPEAVIMIGRAIVAVEAQL